MVPVDEEAEEVEDAEKAVYGRPRRLRAGAEVRGQAACAIAVLRDDEVVDDDARDKRVDVGDKTEDGDAKREDGDHNHDAKKKNDTDDSKSSNLNISAASPKSFLFKVLGCFESGAEADAWVRGVGSRSVVFEDVFVAPTCEWLYPNAPRRKEGKKHYRIDELQRIMDAAQRNPEAVKTYKQMQREKEAREREKEREDREKEEREREGKEGQGEEGGGEEGEEEKGGKEEEEEKNKEEGENKKENNLEEENKEQGEKKKENDLKE